MAVKYHWGRNEILSLPNWERRLYIEKIVRDAEELKREIEREREEALRGRDFGR